MTFGEAVRSGFQIIHRRLQLVGVQAVLMVVNCISFFIIVGIPLGIAFVIFGLDLTGLSHAKDILSMFTSPSDFIAKYFWMVLMVVVFSLLYITLVTTLGLYVFSGSAGIIGRAVREPSLPFSMKQFFVEARQFFFPLLRYAFLTGLVFVVIAFMLGLFGGGIAALVSAAKAQDSTLALFLGIFFSLVLSLAAVSVLLLFLAVTVHGVAVLYFRRGGAWRAFKDAGAFLRKRQDAFWLYSLLFLGYICGSFFAMLISYPFHLIPILGTIISFPLQLLSYLVQGYLGLIVLAIVFAYYHELEIKEEEPVAAQPEGAKAIDEGSTNPEDTSALRAPQQDETPQEKEEKPEG